MAFYNWTGCYVGGHGGGMWVSKEWFDRQPGSATFGSHGSRHVDGFLGGVQAGCDYQFAGGWVIGIAGDYAWTDADGSRGSIRSPASPITPSVKSLASVTGRIGYAWDRFLGYVKGGGAWERDDYDFSPPALITGTASETRSGWTVGVGGEYAFTNYLTGFIEYNYYDFGNRDQHVHRNRWPFVYRHQRNQERRKGRPQSPVRRLGRPGRGQVLSKYAIRTQKLEEPRVPIPGLLLFAVPTIQIVPSDSTVRM